MTEPTLRDMLQQCRHLFDHIVYGQDAWNNRREPADRRYPDCGRFRDRLPADPEPDQIMFDNVALKSVAIIRAEDPVATASGAMTTSGMIELWCQEQRSALRKLMPDGAMTGATREIQAGLGAFLVGLPRAWREGRPLAVATRCAGVHVRRASHLWRHQHRALGMQGRPAVEGWHRPLPGQVRGQAEGPRDQARFDGGRAAGHRSLDSDAARGRLGPDRQE